MVWVLIRPTLTMALLSILEPRDISGPLPLSLSHAEWHHKFAAVLVPINPNPTMVSIPIMEPTNYLSSCKPLLQRLVSLVIVSPLNNVYSNKPLLQQKGFLLGRHDISSCHRPCTYFSQRGTIKMLQFGFSYSCTYFPSSPIAFKANLMAKIMHTQMKPFPLSPLSCLPT